MPEGDATPARRMATVTPGATRRRHPGAATPAPATPAPDLILAARGIERTYGRARSPCRC